MTRINCVPVQELCRQHLIAEYRELPRVFKLAAKWWNADKHETEELPNSYRLGAGHVKFFYDKVWYLANRFYDLVHEMQRRGYKPQFRFLSYSAQDFPSGALNHWEPDDEALALNRKRIAERMPNTGGPVKKLELER